MLAAATTSSDTIALFIRDIATWITETPTNRAMSDLYDITSGE